MPQSKRNKLVTLSKTQKKGREKKTEAVEKIRDWTSKYERIFVLTVANMRNAILKEIREALPDSRLFFGKNKIVQLALGRSRAEEVFKNVHKIAARIKGQCGLLFTNSSLEETNTLLTSFERSDFARTGDEVSQNVVLKAGSLRHVSHSLLSQLRALNMPVEMRAGFIEVTRDMEVCEKGQKLTSEQARILKFLGLKLAVFRMQVQVFWDKKSGKVHRLKIEDDSGSQDDESVPTKTSKAAGKGKLRSKETKATRSVTVNPEDVENPTNATPYDEASVAAIKKDKRKKAKKAPAKVEAESTDEDEDEDEDEDVEME